MEKATVLANFGGPRSLEEIEPFLRALLTDRDVIHTPFPQPIHNWIFGRVAKKRAPQIAPDYESIGGSPIFADTEWLAKELEKELGEPVIPFHRYLPATHEAFLAKAREYERLRFFPMFPQFTYATTGSIARWMEKHLLVPMQWVKSYPDHPAFIDAYEAAIREMMPEGDVVLFCSAHGTPKKFVEEGDPYSGECERTFHALMKRFPNTRGLLAYQSQFGKAEWLRPYTKEMCEQVEGEHIVFVPIAFTSDHIETLFEIETEYMPIIRERGMQAHRVPALNRRPEWIRAITTILKEASWTPNQSLIRK